MIRYSCPSCHVALTAQNRFAGETVFCSACGHRFEVVPQCCPEQVSQRQVFWQQIALAAAILVGSVVLITLFMIWAANSALNSLHR